MSSNNSGDNNPGGMGTDSGSVSSGRVRPIDAPDLPAWRVRGGASPAPRSSAPERAGHPATVDAEEDAPTQSILDRPPALDPRVLSAEDPRELARKLAEEAKLRMTATAPRAGQAPVPQREPQERKEEPTMSAEDPRELARRLAEEAKKRLREPAPEPAVPPEPSYAREPFFGDVSGETDNDAAPYGASDDEEGPAIRVVEERPAAERVAATGRPLSALEALALAREQERRAKASQPPRPAEAPRPAPALQREPSQQVAQRETASAAPRSGQAPLGSIATIVRRVFAEAEVEPALPVSNPEVFRALWRAHGARALHEGDIYLVATASVLLDAVGRIPPGWLAAARMRIHGSYWAVFVDLERGVLLGVARPAEVYLAGMG